MHANIISITFRIRPTRFALLALLLGLSYHADVAAQNFWLPTNGPYGAYVDALAIDNISKHIFAGTVSGGVFRSTDNGSNWTAINSGLINLYVTSLAIKTTGEIFAGTFDNSVFCSTSNGNTWSACSEGLPLGTRIRALTVNSVDDIFAGAGGVFQRKNGENQWKPTGLRDIAVLALAISKNGYIFAGTEDDGTPARGGVYCSKDSGATWTSVGSQLAEYTIISLAIKTSGHVFAGTNVNKGGWRLENDSDTTWTQVLYGNIHSFATNDDDEILAGGDGKILHSTDNGDNWITTNTRFANPYSVLALAFNRTTRDILAGTIGGVFRSSDNGESWPPANNGLGSAMRSVAIDSTGRIFASASSGVYRSLDDGNTWTPMRISGISSQPIAIDRSERVFVGVPDSVYRSTDNGSSWTPYPIQVSNSVEALTINASEHIFAGTKLGRIYRSIDHGNTWETVFSDSGADAVQAFAISASGHIYAGTNGRGVYISKDSGNTWQRIVFSSGNIQSLAVSANEEVFVGTHSGGYRFRVDDPDWRYFGKDNGLTNTNILSLAFNKTGHIFAGTGGGGVFRSINNSDKWMPINSGLTQTLVRWLTFNKNGYIFAGTGGGVFRSRQSTTSLSLIKTIDFFHRSDASDYKPTDYLIVGLPGASNRSVEEFLGPDQGKNWQVYWDNGNSSNNPNDYFVPFKDDTTFRFTNGRAFWVIKKEGWEINTTVPIASLNPAGEVVIRLHPGWNLITNPFDVPIPWSVIKTTNLIEEPIWSYNEGFDTSSNFAPFEGYYFFNRSGTQEKDSLRIPDASLASAISVVNIDPAIWRVSIALSAGEFNDKNSSFGIARDASSDLGRHDFRKPRALAAMPTVEFKRPTWDTHYSTFATDIRPEFENSESWEFDVRAIPRQPAELSFSGISRVPVHFEVFLIDEGRAQSLNLRDDSLFHFTPAAELMKFRVAVGRKDKVQEQLNSLALPKEFALGHNYPNPFNPTTTIPVGVPVASEIKLKIYNILGEEVRTVYTGMIEAGRYWFTWDSKNEAGINVASGVYFYRLHTSKGRVLTNKMIFMR